MDVVRLVIRDLYAEQWVLLREVGGDRCLDIAAGYYEAAALRRALTRETTTPPRPMTVDAWASTIAALGGKVQDVLVSALREGVYYAELRIRQAGRPGLVTVDVRPSDAFPLAVQADAPLLVAAHILAMVGWRVGG